MPRHEFPSDFFLVVLLNLWPLSLNANKVLKSSLRLVCSEACAIIDDLQRCVRAQLRATIRGCHLSAFRRIEHLHVYGTCSPQPHQLARVLQGPAWRLTDVTHLDLHKVRCLSGDCVAAVAACMPRLTHLNVLDDRTDGLAGNGLLSRQAPPPSPPDQMFFAALHALPQLSDLVGVSPTANTHLQALGALTRLTRLQLRGDLLTRLDLRPLGHLAELRVLNLQLDSPTPSTLLTAANTPLPPDLAWVSSLARLEELRGCPSPGMAGVRALQSCPQLTCLSFASLDCLDWEDAAPLAPGASPALCLPALRELHFLSPPFLADLAGFVRTVRLPSLGVLDTEMWIEGVGTPEEEWKMQVQEVVRGLPTLDRFQVDLDSNGLEGVGAVLWQSAVQIFLEVLQVLFACEGRMIQWHTHNT